MLVAQLSGLHVRPRFVGGQAPLSAHVPAPQQKLHYNSVRTLGDILFANTEPAENHTQ